MQEPEPTEATSARPRAAQFGEEQPVLIARDDVRYGATTIHQHADLAPDVPTQTGEFASELMGQDQRRGESTSVETREALEFRGLEPREMAVDVLQNSSSTDPRRREENVAPTRG